MARGTVCLLAGIRLLAGLAALWAGMAGAQTPPPRQGDLQTPRLRINTPFAGPLWRLDVDADETVILSSSADKSFTAWPLADPARPVVHRVPLRVEQERRAHAIAISPRERVAAYSTPLRVGDDRKAIAGSASISIVRLADGRVLRRIEDVTSRPQGLRFSPDGAYLAAVLSDGCGLRLWSTSDWSLVASDDAGHGSSGPCTGQLDTTDVLFVGDGSHGPWLVTSGDSGIRTYRRTPSGIALERHARPDDIAVARPSGIALSPDGKRLAVGDRLVRRAEGAVRLQVAILDVETLRPVREPLALRPEDLVYADRLDINQVSLERVAWVRAGAQEHVLAGGGLGCQHAPPRALLIQPATPLDVCLVRWTIEAPEASVRFLPVGQSRVMDLRALPKRGGIAFATQRNVGAVTVEGRPLGPSGRQLAAENRAADFRDGALDFAVSADGKVVSWLDYRGLGQTPIRVTLDLARLAVTEAAPPPGLTLPDQDANLIRDWRNNSRSTPILRGVRLAGAYLDPGETHRSAALKPGKRLAVLGSSAYLRAVSFATATPRLACQIAMTAEVFRVNLSADGRIVVSGHGDGTLRWHRLAEAGEGCTLEPLLSVYIERLGPGEWSWIAWRPTGEFANDPRARERLEWQMAGADGQVERLPFEQLLDKYDRAAVIASLDQPTGTGSRAGPAPEQAMTSELQNRLRRSVVQPRSPEAFAAVSSETVRFRLDLTQSLIWPKQLGIAMGNGAKVAKAFQGQSLGPDTPIRIGAPGIYEVDVALPAVARRQRGVVHVCFFLDGERDACHPVNWEGDLVPPPRRRLWAVLVGFSKHEAPTLTLDFAQNDALDLARLFVRDYQRRVVERTSRIAADFHEIHIDLVVAPSTPQAAREIEELGKLPYVKLHPATKEGIAGALQALAERDRAGELGNDLLLYYHSGHGIVHPYNRAKGRTGFLTPATALTYTPEVLEQTVLDSSELLDLLAQISAEKLVAFDACRTPIPVAGVEPFDPGLMQKEFDQRELQAHFFFSAQAGQYANELPDLAFDSGRPVGQRGNGVFTYAFLDALTNKDADLKGASGSVGKIEVIEIKRHVDVTFDPDRADAVVTRLFKAKNMSLSQRPVYVPARWFSNDVVRSLDLDP